MPGGDGTGPMGMGSMTGRGAGYCAGYSAPGYANSIPGYGGFGYGRGVGGAWFGRGGGGRGRRNWFQATGVPGNVRFNMGLPAWGGSVPYAGSYGPELAPEQETDMLKSQAEFLKQQMDDIQGRISTLDKVSSKKKDE